MAFNRFTGNVLNVSALPDRVTGQANTLKAVFDQAGVDIKTALNGLMDQLEALTAAGNIGAEVDSTVANTVQGILTAFDTAIGNRYTKAETDTLVASETNNLVKSITFNSNTGVFTITKADDTTTTIDTALEKVPATFELIESSGTYYLRITNLDGTYTQTNVTELMNVYTFNNSDTIAFSETTSGNTKTLTASIRDNSITMDKLALSALSSIQGYVEVAEDSAAAANTSATNASASATAAGTSATNASASATSASQSATSASESATSASESASTASTKATQASSSAAGASGSASTATSKATEAQSWAVGGTGTRQGEDTNNAKYWGEQTQSAGQSALSDISSALNSAVGAINTAGTQQTSAVNSAGTTQVGNVNSAGTTQTNAVNAAGQQKLDEINSNHTVQQVNDHEVRITRLEKVRHIYGVKRARNNNSSSAWERTDDAIGLVANAQIGTTPVRNDFDNIKPWCDIIRKNIDMTTKNTTAYYGEAEYKLDGSNGDVYTEYPDIYLKKWQDEDHDHVQIADGPVEGFTKIKSFDVQSYLAGLVNGQLRSYSGLAPARSKSIGAYRTLARELGNEFCLLDWRYFVQQLLYLVEYADYNSQAKLGKGLTSMRDNDADKALIAESNTNRIIISTNGTGNFIVGQTISIGNTAKETFQVAESRVITAINDYDDGTITGVEIVFDGTPVNIAVNNVIWSSGQISGGGDFLGMKSGCLVDDGKHVVNYRGTEGMAGGNIMPFIDGINIHDGQVYICYDPSEYASDKFTAPYEAIGYVNAYNGNNNYNGYVKTLGYDANHPLVSMPTELGGSSSTYMTDNYYISTGDRVARVGGYLGNGLGAGLWYWYLYNTSSNASWTFGARVLKYQT